MNSKSVCVYLRVRWSLVVAMLLFWGFSQAEATVYFVHPQGSVSGDGLSWASARSTVMGAVALSHAGDEIWVAAGTYAEAVGLPNGVSLYGGFAGTETLLSQRSASGNVTVIDGSTASGGGPADHVVTVADAAGVRLDGFVIRGGVADGTGTSGERGGALFASNVTAGVFARCTFLDNAAPTWSGQGGGAYVAGSTVVFEDCLFAGNAAGDAGGALSCYQGTVTLQNCVFRGNAAYSSGAIYACGNAALTLTECTFDGNSAAMFGGAVYARDALATLADCVLLGNSGAEGGAVMGFDANLQVSRCTFAGNSASTYGGGLAAYSSSVVMNECTLVGNAAGYRGGGGVESHQGILLQLSNCVLVGNRAEGVGGGVMVDWQTCILNNCTLVSNDSATSGGAVYVDYAAGLTARNTLITGNGRVAIGLSASATLQLLDHCFFSNNPQGDFVWSGNTAALTGAGSIETLLPQAEGTLEGFAGFKPGESGALTSAPIYESGPNRTLLMDAGKAYAPGALRGSFLSIAGAANTYSYVIDNTEDTITVVGNLSGVAGAGATYQFLDTHLGGGSACVDRGTPINAPSIDIDGETRGYDVSGVGEGGLGAFYDIGADESIDPDSDGDWLSDGLEEFLGTNPAVKDTDGDGVDDLGEYMIIGTDPLRQDSDGDWFTDGEELYGGSDPKSPGSIPYPIGDVNHSGKVDAADVQAVINGVLGKPSLWRTDIDLSGRPDAKDVQLVINAVLHPVPM